MARNFGTPSTQKIEWGDIGRLDGLSVLTVCFRLFLTTTGANRKFISKQSAGGSAASALLIQTGNPDSDDLAFSVGDGTNFFGYQTTTGALTTGAWGAWSCVWGGGVSGAIYKNGASQTVTDYSSGTPTTIAATGASFNYGKSDTAVDGLDGSLAEVALWDVAFSASDVATYAAGVSPLCIRPANLLLYTPLWGRLSPELDLIENATGTLTGTSLADHPRTIYKQRRSRCYSIPRTSNIHTARREKQKGKVDEPVPEYVW